MSVHFQLNPDLYRLKDGSVSVHVAPVKRVVALHSESCVAVESPLKGLRRPPLDATRMTPDWWRLSVDSESPLLDAAQAYTVVQSDFKKLQLVAQKAAQKLLAGESIETSANNQREVLNRIMGWHEEMSRKTTETILAWVRRSTAYEDETCFEVDVEVVKSLSLKFPVLGRAAQDISEEMTRRRARWALAEGKGIIRMLEARRFYDQYKDESSISRTLKERRSDLVLRQAQETASNQRYQSYIDAKHDRHHMERLRSESFDLLQKTAAALWEVHDRQDDPAFVSALNTILGDDKELDAEKLFTFLEADNKRYCSWLTEKLSLEDIEIGGATSTEIATKASNKPYYTHPTSIKKVRPQRCFFQSLSPQQAELCRSASEMDETDLEGQDWVEMTAKRLIVRRNRSRLPRGTYTKARGTVIGSGVEVANEDPSEADSATTPSGDQLSVAEETAASTPMTSVNGDIPSAAGGTETSSTDKGPICPPSNVWTSSTRSVKPLHEIQWVQESLKKAMLFADRRKQRSRRYYGPSLHSYLPTGAVRPVQEVDLTYTVANESLADRMERLEGLARSHSASDATEVSTQSLSARRNSLA